MNKNPFLPQPSYTPPQPPLPPGPPPPQPAAEYQHHWPGYPPAQYTSQWTPPTITRPGDQNPLFANYGYGPQNHWPRQQQQQQQQHYHPPPPVPQPPPLSVAAAAYNPYQPAVTYPYAQPAPQAMAQPQFTQPQQPMFAPHLPPQPMQMTQQPSRIGQQSTQQQPPAKRPRYDGPNQIQNRSQPFQPPNPPHQGGGRGGGPGSNQVPLGSGNRGGAGGNRGNLGGGGRGRGGSMNSGRGGGMPGRTGRGGSTYNPGGGNTGRGGGSTSGSMRSHGSRGHLGPGKDFHNRRGPGGPFVGGSGSYGQGSGSFRNGRNQGHSSSNRNQRHDNATNPPGVKDSSSSSLGSSKRDERRRTLTDFKIIGLEISELSWTWGAIPHRPSSSEATLKMEDVEIEAEGTSEPSVLQVVVKTENVDDASALSKSNVDVPGSDGPGDDNASVTTEVANTIADVANASYASMESSKDTSGHIPHSRIRIYFHTPVSVDDPRSFSIPSDSRKGKRKKLDDDDDGDVEEGRGPPPPTGDRATSVAPSMTETAASEADWLMAAIVEGEETQKASVNGEEDDGDDGERQHVSDIVEPHDCMSDVDSAEQNVLQGNENKAQSDETVTASDTAGFVKEPVPNGTDVPMDSTVSSSQNELVDKTTNSTSSTVPSVPHFTFSLTSDAIPSDSSNSVETVQETQIEQAEMQTQATEPLEAEAQTQTETQPTGSSFLQPSQTNETDHLPEPPASPMSNNFLSTSSSSTFGENTSQYSSPGKNLTRTPSANRISISYAGGDRRLIIDSEVCDGMKIFRGEGRIEIQIRIQSDEVGLVGLSMESLSDSNKTFTPVDKLPADLVLPPFGSALSPTVTLVAYLDTERPLSEPRWLKTGDIQDWLRSMFGKATPAGATPGNGWERKITVADPDPPPTIWTVLESWATNSPVGNGPTERQRFVKTHLSETENLLEILLRLVRGERATAFQSSATISNSSVSGPLLTALDQGTAHGAQQTHVSLAVLAIFQMTLEYATKAVGANAKKEIESRVGEIIRCLPSHLTYKSLDGMFKEWKAEKKGQGR